MATLRSKGRPEDVRGVKKKVVVLILLLAAVLSTYFLYTPPVEKKDDHLPGEAVVEPVREPDTAAGEAFLKEVDQEEMPLALQEAETPPPEDFPDEAAEEEIPLIEPAAPVERGKAFFAEGPAEDERERGEDESAEVALVKEQEKTLAGEGVTASEEALPEGPGELDEPEHVTGDTEEPVEGPETVAAEVLPGEVPEKEAEPPEQETALPPLPAERPALIFPVPPIIGEGQENGGIRTGEADRRSLPEVDTVISPDERPDESFPEGEEDLADQKEADPSMRIMEETVAALSPKDRERRVALFPFENLSGDRDALTMVLPEITAILRKKGMDVVDEKNLTPFLCAERIRNTGAVPGKLAGTIGKKFGASKILTGSVISYKDDENPVFAILARLIDSSDGSILWADYAGATGEDFIGLLNLGQIKSISALISRVTDTLFTSFKPEELGRKSEASFTVAVMPFRNNSNFSYAGRIAMYMFLVELLKKHETRPVEYGDVREAITDLRIRSRGELNYENIKALAAAVNARGIVLGVVDDYSRGPDLSSPPRVALTTRLIDGSSNKILWFNSEYSDGEKNIIALDWGRMRTVHGVAHRVVSELTKKMALSARK